jgi:hypothetical protein
MNQSGFFVTPVLNPRTINSKFLDWEPNAFLLSLIFGKILASIPFYATTIAVFSLPVL